MGRLPRACLRTYGRTCTGRTHVTRDTIAKGSGCAASRPQASLTENFSHQPEHHGLGRRDGTAIRGIDLAEDKNFVNGSFISVVMDHCCIYRCDEPHRDVSLRPKHSNVILWAKGLD